MVRCRAQGLLPQPVKPTYAAQRPLFAFFAAWNEFFTVLILLSDESKFTLPVVLTTLLSGTFGSIRWGVLDASVVITALPCLVIYGALQRHFVSGVMAGMGR